MKMGERGGEKGLKTLSNGSDRWKVLDMSRPSVMVEIQPLLTSTGFRSLPNSIGPYRMI